jgi:hypothetical protein
MIGEICCVKYDTSIEDRKELLLTSGHVFVPQLQSPSVLFFPILVEIDE